MSPSSNMKSNDQTASSQGSQYPSLGYILSCRRQLLQQTGALRCLLAGRTLCVLPWRTLLTSRQDPCSQEEAARRPPCPGWLARSSDVESSAPVSLNQFADRNKREDSGWVRVDGLNPHPWRSATRSSCLVDGGSSSSSGSRLAISSTVWLEAGAHCPEALP